MKENFDKCLEMLLEHEGGFTADRRDKGNAGDGHGNQGSTMLGVTSRVYADWTGEPAPIQVMKALTHDDVAPIYKKNYWDRVKGDQLPSGVDWCAFDWAVNSGSGRPAKAIQRAVGATQDGAIGNQTLGLVSEKDPAYIIDYVYTVRQAFYEGLDDYKHFGRGWSRRNKETLEQALSMV
jgi:lysozyme family protein